MCSEYLWRKCLVTRLNSWLWMRRISLLIFPPSSQDCQHAEIPCKFFLTCIFNLPPARRCNRIDPQYERDTPQAMITLDMWLPPSQEVDSWGLLDAGQLGPAVRYSNYKNYSRKLSLFQIWFLISQCFTNRTIARLEPLESFQKQRKFE